MFAYQEMIKQEFKEKLQISSSTMMKLNKEYKEYKESMPVILRICEFFNCNIGEICDGMKRD